MKIQVFGSGCQLCAKLNDITQKAVIELGLPDKVEYITGVEGMEGIIKLGILSSPVLAVDDKPVLTGYEPDIEKVKKAIVGSVKDDSNCGGCNCGGKC